jgi:hypothetical protein
MGKIYVAPGIVANKTNGFARPKVSIEDKKVVKCGLSTKKDYVFFTFDMAKDKTEGWNCSVADLKGLDKSPIGHDDKGDFIYDNLMGTIPALLKEQVSFHVAK